MFISIITECKNKFPRPICQLNTLVQTFCAGSPLAITETVQDKFLFHLVRHLDEVGHVDDRLHVMITQVAATADALCPLHVGSTQHHYSRQLVVVLGVQPNKQQNYLTEKTTTINIWWGFCVIPPVISLKQLSKHTSHTEHYHPTP